MMSWGGAPHNWDKAAVPWRQTVFLPQGAAGINRLESVNAQMRAENLEAQPRHYELCGTYDLTLRYYTARGGALENCRLTLPFRVALPPWWQEEQIHNIMVNAVSCEADVLSPQVLEFRAQLLVQNREKAKAAAAKVEQIKTELSNNFPVQEVYEPSAEARRVLEEYSHNERNLTKPNGSERKARTAIPTANSPADLAELRAAAVKKLMDSGQLDEPQVIKLRYVETEAKNENATAAKPQDINDDKLEPNNAALAEDEAKEVVLTNTIQETIKSEQTEAQSLEQEQPVAKPVAAAAGSDSEADSFIEAEHHTNQEDNTELYSQVDVSVLAPSDEAELNLSQNVSEQNQDSVKAVVAQYDSQDSDNITEELVKADDLSDSEALMSAAPAESELNDLSV